MKKSLVLVYLMVCSVIVQAQINQKLNLQLVTMMQNPELQQKQINILVQGDINKIQKLTEMASGLYRYAVGDIATVRIPVYSLSLFSNSSHIKKIELPGSGYTAMNDSMRSAINANAVHAGLPPLLQSFDGTGVVVGIIDTGVDLTHPDLQDSTGNTRIKYLWDQRKPVAANTPQPYGYGQEWDNTEIDAGAAVSSNDMQGFGHGTHVSGIAAGDGSGNGKNKGVAPGADLIEVAFDFNNVTNPTYVDAVDYIFSKAQLLGKPCVINASLGDYYGSHDGYDLQSQMISTLIDQQPGRTLVAAAGNAGTIPFHLGYNVTSDTSFTWLRHNPAYPNNFIQIWGDTSDFKNIDFSIGADVNSTTASFRGNLPFRDIFYNLGIFKQDTLFSIDGNQLAIIQSFGSIQGPTYLLEFNIIPDSTTYLWRLMTTGSGKMDMWKFYDGTGQPGYVNTNLPPSSVVPEIIYYQLPDSNSTIVSGFQCLDNVITVANYGNRSFYVDINGNTYTDASVTPGDIITNSSWGPTRDGRIKPDIAAPGSITLSSGQLSLMAIWQNQPSNAPKIAEDGFHFRDGGTSSASPVVAGIAALFLQQNPTATAMQIKDAILQCAVQDSFTGTGVPNNIWGAGKADALNTLINCALTSVNELSTHPALAVYPNPAFNENEITVYFNQFDSNSKNEIYIVDALGRTINKYKLNNSKYIKIMISGYATGIYSIHFIKNGTATATTKIAILN